jgi:hypothetical protein
MTDSTVTVSALTIANNDLNDKTWCLSNTITVTVSSLSAQTYNINDSALSITFSAFSLSQTCPGNTFTYSALQSDGSALPSTISFSSATRTFSVSSSKAADAGSYTI